MFRGRTKTFVYLDEAAFYNDVIIGYKAKSSFDSGLIYVPYIPTVRTGAVKGGCISEFTGAPHPPCNWDDLPDDLFDMEK